MTLLICNKDQNKIDECDASIYNLKALHAPINRWVGIGIVIG